MRIWTALCSLVLLLVVGCAVPPSTGGLWAQQNLEQERALFRLTDSERAERMHAVELGLADEALQSERARLTAELDACPGPPAALSVSAGDRVRDSVRARVQGDGARLGVLAQLSLADWRLRRARATGMQRYCEDAREALTTPAAVGQPTSSDVLGALPAATVTRDAPAATATGDANAATAATARPDGSAGSVSRDGSTGSASRDGSTASMSLHTVASTETLALYALGYVDSVYAPAPLPQYLALVYGGFLQTSARPPAIDDETAQQVVDREAPAYPQWEPDALYAALRQ